ncbi:MAG: hypothetical protein ABEI52_01550, partial [Halobacteriaceae archaeon]
PDGYDPSMGLRCSIIGHNFANAETIRDQEERGEEVVITVQEIETCTRCGEERVVSESTEVRSIEPAPDSIEQTVDQSTSDATTESPSTAKGTDGSDVDMPAPGPSASRGHGQG